MAKQTVTKQEFEQFKVLYKKFQTEVVDTTAKSAEVVVTTAIALSDSGKDNISTHIRNLGEFTDISFIVNPSILGGLQVSIGDWKFDGSLKTQLRHLSNQLIQ